MNIKSKFIIIMITFFALFSCMTIISAADVHNANYTDTHNQVINEQSTINEPVINTEIKTLNRENNNIQTNQRNNQNNDKFQDQQSKLNSKEMKSLSENQKQPDNTKTNMAQQMTKMPEQDQINSPTNMTPTFNDKTPEIQPENKEIPENQNQPINDNNLNNNTIPQQPQNNKNTMPTKMSNITPKFNEDMSDVQEKNTDKQEPKQEDMKQPQSNENNITFDLNKNQQPQQPQENKNKNIPQTITNINPNNNNIEKQNKNNIEKQNKNNNAKLPMDDNKQDNMEKPAIPTNNNKPTDINKPETPMNTTQPSDMGQPMSHMNGTQPSGMDKPMSPMNSSQPVDMERPEGPMNGTQPSDMGQPMSPMNSSQPGNMERPEGPMNGTQPTDMNNMMPSNNNMDNSQSSSVTYSTDVDGQLLVSGTTTSKDNSDYSVSDSETNTVLVQNGGTLTLSNSKITKTGDTTNSGNSEFLGTNAAILTTYGSTAYIINSTIVTDASGANAIFATNTDSSHSGATIYVNDTTIDTYHDKSRGLDATYGGTIIANNVTINTRGGSCAAVATDRGEGTVTVSNSVLNTGVDDGTGQGSPCIYSTGEITVINSTGTSYGAQIACIEGKNSITLINSTLYCSGEGNRQENGNYVDLAGVFIYQSMSGDADVGTAVFTSTNSDLTILSTSDYYTTAPMFYVTNTKGIVTITNTTLNFGSGVLIKVSNQNQWGTTGSNGGDLTFNAIDESLNGNIIVGDYSSLSLDLKDSTYNGAITTSSSATSSVTIEAGSTWTLTGDSYVTSLTNYGTIICGDYTLYVNGVKYTG